jgi:hypothetical protein
MEDKIMAYSKKELLEELIEFNDEYGRFPTRQDFSSKKIAPGKSTYYRVFGSMDNAIKQAELYKTGEIEIEDEQKKNIARAINNKSNLRCFVCGNYVENYMEYHETFNKIVSARFINLLKSSNGQSYLDGVMGSIHAVWGPRNPVVTRALLNAGYLKEYKQRYGENSQENEY